MSTSKRDRRASGDLVMAPRVPHGLAAAVEGLTREVIRHHPEDIYVFAAQHFEELLKLRDEYGAVTNLPGKSTNTAALREMNQALKKRSGIEKGSKSSKERSGWSMNETARVLERHRSIFGDRGRKLSPEEIRALGDEKENKSRRRDQDSEKFGNSSNYQKRRGSSERFVRRKIPPKNPDSGENKSKSESNGSPKIISQIPTLTQNTGLLAKDIKSELRKNRNSSRNGRSIRERAERKASERIDRFEINPRQTGTTKKTLTRTTHQTSLDKLVDAENESDYMCVGRILTDNQKPKTDAGGRSRSLAKMPRTLSMDRVREFVIEKFRESESLEELRSTNYVDRVQEVIDEASPSILRRVKELSTRSAGRCRGYESVDESTSTSTRSDKSNQTDDIRSKSAMSASGRSRRTTRKTKSKSKTSGADSLEGIETLASETEQPKDNRNEIEAGKVKKGFTKGTPNGLSGESDASDYADLVRKASASSSISLPAVRPPSSKNHSRSVSRSDSDNLVLPPIPPEAPRSAKHREELILPSLQIPKEVTRGVEAVLEDNLLHDSAEAELNLPDAPTDEIFKDSLNVTPEIAASPRPDSLEPEASGSRNDEGRDNIAELKAKLNGIDSPADDQGVKDVGGDSEMKDRLKEIEETEIRIENILKSESQESRGEFMDAVSVREKLVEIQEAEERLRDILDPGANIEDGGGDLRTEQIQSDPGDPGMRERLIEIEETEKRIEKILDPETQTIQKDAQDPGMKEKLMEIEETEKRIEKILNPEEVREAQTTGIENDMKEKLIDIEDAEERIEKIVDPEASQEAHKDANDYGMKKKLMEIEETEKRIERIFHSEVQDEETNADLIKNKLIEIEEAEKCLSNVFDSTAEIQQGHDSIPKTPFIPEIASEYVTSANQGENIDEVDEEEVPTNGNQQSTTPDATENNDAERVETRVQTAEPKIEQFSSGTPDSLGNSYVLTEGSPYDIPDSVTTVIIPERQMDTPSSDILEIVLEDDLGEVSGSFEAADAKRREESPEEGNREISLRNILDNFGEVVHQEAVPSSVDVDFIKNLKTSSDVVISRKDLGLIAEEDDNEIAEIGAPEAPKDPVLHDIAETEEVLDVESPETPPSTKSHDSVVGDSTAEAKPPTEMVQAGFAEASELEEQESEDPDAGGSGGRKTRSLETIDPEVASLRQNVTYSGTTESTDEVKETTISDDAENTAAESSVTSPSCGEETGARNSESSNEVKETTISDRPTEGAGKNLFSLVPQCHGTMPHVPELNLDSLQDITVSSFQLSDDATAEEEEEESDAGQPQSENYPSVATDDAHESQEHEPVREDIILKEKVEIKEDPCTKITAYVEGPNLENSERKTVELESTSSKEEDEQLGLLEREEKIEEVIEEAEEPNEMVEQGIIESTKEPEEATEIVAEKVGEVVPELESNHTHVEIATNVENKGSVEDPEKVDEKTVEDTDLKKVLEEKSEELSEDEDKQVSEEILQDSDKDILEKVNGEIHEKLVEELVNKAPEELHEDSSKHIVERKPEEVHEEEADEVQNKGYQQLAENILEEEPEEKREDEAGKPTEEEVHKEVIEGSVNKEFEEKPEDSAKKESKKEPEDEAEELPPAEDAHEKTVGSSAEQKSEDKAEVEPENLAKKVLEEEPEDKAEKLSERACEKTVENPDEKDHEVKPEDSVKNEPQGEPEEATSKSQISELETVSLSDFKALEMSIGEEYSQKNNREDIKAVENVESNPEPESSSDPKVNLESIEIRSSSGMRVAPEVSELTEPEGAKDSQITDKNYDPVFENLVPPKAEVVTNDLDEINAERLREYHIYVPEATASEEFSTTESSTFNSAATKIQAGVRGFLTRRRLQSAQRRSSTLDSVPSIQDSLAADVPHLEPIEEVGLSQAATTIQSSYRGYKARQRLRREDAVQKTTVSVESPFSGVGLQHTGEFHDCLPLPQFQHDEKKIAPVFQPVNSQTDPDPESLITPDDVKDANKHQEIRDWVTESTTTNDEIGDDRSTFGLLVNKYPYAQQGLNLVVLSGNDTVLQSQYLNFITSIEEVHNDEGDSLVPGTNMPKVTDAFSTMKSNAGIESLPLDNTDTDISAQDASVSAREPLAVPGSPTGLVIEELSKTEEESLPADATSTLSTNHVKSETNVDNDVVSEAQDESLDLPGHSLERCSKDVDRMTVTSGKDCSETGKTEDVSAETRASLTADVPQDASLGTMSFSMNVDDMLGLGAESDPPARKMKPIFEVTVTPRDLLKLTNRSQGSQASGDRVESPVTMMQIVPKSVEDKSDRSEDEREVDAKRGEQEYRKSRSIDEIPEETEVIIVPSNNQEVVEGFSNKDEESSDGMSKTFPIDEK